MESSRIIIAIDGPAASGKSTTAKRLAKRLGYTYIDTGAMYRAVTLKMIRRGIYDRVMNDAELLQQVLDETEVVLNGDQVFLDGQDVTQEIRTNEVSTCVSKISSLKPVREKLVFYQRKMGLARGVVMDGRDIGTVVFPDAELKIFMIADPRERATRRYEELRQKSSTGEAGVTLEALEKEILQRDEEDRQREVAPLRKANDATELDTSTLTIDEQVETIYQMALDVIANVVK